MPGVPNFMTTVAEIEYDSASDLTGRKHSEVDSFVGPDELSLKLRGPEGVSTITGRIQGIVSPPQMLPESDVIWS